jgi:hypothetical protein
MIPYRVATAFSPTNYENVFAASIQLDGFCAVGFSAAYFRIVQVLDASDIDTESLIHLGRAHQGIWREIFDLIQQLAKSHGLVPPFRTRRNDEHINHPGGEMFRFTKHHGLDD